MSVVMESKELGTLIVVVGKARNLPNKSRFGKQDPFCTVRVNEEKQRTKAIKRGGQHPEWDEEFRFPIQEDLDDVLIRSESQSEALNSSTDSPGVTTAAALASRSRKGPLGRNGGKSLRVACYADDAKEPEMIGECVVSIDEVLKKGEVDEWYELLYKEKYSGEVYLELTFYSNDAPPIKRNVPRPSISGYGLNGHTPSSSSSSLSGRPHMSTALTASGSVSGMSLYIPPYVSPARVPSPSPMPPSSSFADLGLPPGHRRQSLSPLPPGQPSYPPSSSISSMSSSQSTLTAMDSLTRPMSSLSVSSSSRLLPLPTGPPAPPQQQYSQHNGQHRHSVGGPSDAPWGALLSQAQPAPAPAPHARPLSTSDAAPWDQGRRGATPTPLPRPTSGMSHQNSNPGYPPPTHRTPSPLPSSLIPGGPPYPQHHHASSFSGPTQAPTPANYLLPSPAPTPVPHSASAPPIPPNTGHYTMPTSSFAGIQQDLQRAASPMPAYQTGQQYPGQVQYQQTGQSTWQSPPPSSEVVNGYASQAQGSYQDHGHQNGYGQPPPSSHTPQPYTPHTPAPQSYVPPTPTPQYQPPHPSQPPQAYAAPPTPQPPQHHSHHSHSHSLSSLPSQPARQPSPARPTQGYVPWYQQTAPPPAPIPTQPQYTQDHHQPTQYASPAPPIPSHRPVPHPPAPHSQQTTGYYPSDKLYTGDRGDQWQNHQGQAQQYSDQGYAQGQGLSDQPYRATTPQPYRATTPQPPRSTTPQPYREQTPQPYQPNTPQPYQPQAYSPAQHHHHHHHSQSMSSLPPPTQRAPQGRQSTIPDPQRGRSPSPIPPQPHSQTHYQPDPQTQPWQAHRPRSASPQPPQNWQSQPPPQDWQSPTLYSKINQDHLRQPSPQPPQGWQSQIPNPNTRAVSPNPSQSNARKDWKTYMQGLSSTPIPPHPSFSQSSGVRGEGGGGNWYTPPPSLPSSIRPPEGWRSTVENGGGWRG